MKNINILLFTLISTYTFAQTHSIDLKTIAQRHPEISKITHSKDFDKDVILFKPVSASSSMQIITESEKVNWEGKKYLVLDVLHNADYSGIIYIDFYKKGGSTDRAIVQQGGQENKAQITPKMGVMPRLRTQVIFPLSYLDGQEIFMARHPRQLKGTVLGRRLNVEDIGKVQLRIDPVSPPDFTPELQIASISLTTTLPAPLPKTSPIVDEFGQWTKKDWPGKVKSEEDLKNKIQKLETTSIGSTFPDDWSKYGGWKKKQFIAKGFFYTHHDGQRWWLVDPEGYAFVSAGIDCINSNAAGAVGGNEDLFKWLPDYNDTKYKDALSDRKEVKMVDFLKTNWIRVYGNDWESRWQDLTQNLMKKYRINTIANWSDLKFAQKAGIPYVIPMRDYPTTDKKLFRDFPDVFDPSYKAGAVKFASQLEPYKNDPYLIGYFLSNEPHWAFGEHIIAFEMFGTNASSFSKKQFISWLTEKYATTEKFNQSCAMSLKNIQELESKTFKETSELSQQALADMNEFSGLLVDEYIKAVCDEVKKVDPNHLNLGLRYAWISSELCYRAGAFFDVFSINGYSFPGPPETAEVARRSGKPVMIGEFHFGSTDRGLPANGIQGAANQTARGEAYRYYLENGFARPEVIGLHYFQWNDQPIMGRFDGENYNIGLFDICNQPYEELLNLAKEAHENVYKVATGEVKPYDKVIKKMPQIFY